MLTGYTQTIKQVQILFLPSSYHFLSSPVSSLFAASIGHGFVFSVARYMSASQPTFLVFKLADMSKGSSSPILDLWSRLETHNLPW